MSAPNKSFDPKQVSALSSESVDAMVVDAIAAFSTAADLESLKVARLTHFGDRSAISLANREIGALPPAAKAEVGKRIGEAKARIKDALESREAELTQIRDNEVLLSEKVDVSVPVDRLKRGARHPLTTLMERLSDVFIAMGYEIAEGPELELEWANFDALYFPKNHPARLMQDTFLVESPDSGVVLRTHTSPIQVRAMLERELPIYVVAPGRVFRTDELDATHTPVFHQIEGLAVDKGLSMADLR
ncbi:MAG: phenylalanine--tRNA ligase subunit alpha, partial [Candidatus Nanopelagicales bacterium]